MSTPTTYRAASVPGRYVQCGCPGHPDPTDNARNAGSPETDFDPSLSGSTGRSRPSGGSPVQMVMATSATEPTAATTCWSTGSTFGARVRSVHSPSPAKNRNWPVADGRHLGGELAGPVEQPDVGVADRLAARGSPGPGRRPPWRRRRRRATARPRSRRTSGSRTRLVAERDGHADQRAVLGPGAVVVLDVLLAEQLLQHEPGVRRALADAAVGDGVLAPVDAGLGVELLELVVGLEGAVVVGRLAPRDVGRGRDVTGALRLLLREVGRGEQPAGVLVGAADVDEVLDADRRDDLVAEGADGEVLLLRGVRRRRRGSAPRRSARGSRAPTSCGRRRAA